MAIFETLVIYDDIEQNEWASTLSTSFEAQQGRKIMNVYSRRQRRRMHAIPAGIALLVFTVLWLYSSYSSADVVLNVKNLREWQMECRHCAVEPRYDVINGEVIHLRTDMGTAALTNRYDTDMPSPEISWGWSLEQKKGQDGAFTLTVAMSEPDSRRVFVIHYLWDLAAEDTGIEDLGEDTYIYRLCGKECGPRRWYEQKRDLVADLAEVTAENFDVRPVGFTLMLGRPGARKADASGFFSRLNVVSRPESESAVPVAASE